MNVPGCMVDGDPGAKLLIVAMAPGREELAHNKPLVGPTGQELWRTLSRKAGVDRSDCYIANTIGEWPEGIDGNPTKTQLDKYWEAFDEAIAASRAHVAVLLGGAALSRVTGLLGGVESWRGYLVAPYEAQELERTVLRTGVYKTSRRCKCGADPKQDPPANRAHTGGCAGCGDTGWAIRKGDPKLEKAKLTVPSAWPPECQWCIPTYHPSAILKSGYTLKPAFAADIMRVGRALRGELEVFDPSWVESKPTSFETGAPAVFDIETGGIAHDIITRIGATNGEGAWTSLWDQDSRDCLRTVLREGGPSVAFNIGFDAPRLAAAGCPIPEPWWDVMLAAATVKPELKKSLNYVTSLYMDTPRWKHLSESQPAKYNAWDVAATRALYYILRAELERTGQLDLFEKRMMPTVPTLVNMTQRGLKVDMPVRDAWLAELSAKRDATFKRWDELAPGQRTSGSKLLWWLVNTAGIPILYSKYGGQTSEAAQLKKLLLMHNLDSTQRAILETLLELRGIEKELKTYAEVDLLGDGCVHPGFLPAGKDDDAFGKGIAGTGRITSSRPNIQNQPLSARRMFIPHDPERNVLLEGDWSQIEARILAELADDEELRGAIREGLHTSNMRVLNVDKTRAKNGFYGWAYGAGKRTLHNTFISRGFYVPEAECEALLRGFDRRFARTAALRRRIAHEVSHNYYLTNAFGRRRYFLGGSRDVPAGLDFQPQSCAADIMWTVLRPLEGALRGAGGSLLATVHDSILIECPRGALDECAAIMKQVMEQPWPEIGGLAVPVELKAGQSWGAMESLPGA